ncbi:alcohol dehydrogenase [Microtetraspora sp. NBRC 13810]|uniref:alcohol dehydrogenase catalytic domain-containing protein n=1 Tax=Microtetraspora sp. NBRC 13810 TaxID=3030990 RepID=UPI0024A5BC46|nr:alcohol dehydrogenase catalytic domain-containing protein [Microtetraspora sp. NBRC 13810]GLW05786.1 alcohol dehydrogenase [Microtetraspora sp. NBRC 13810]
MKAAVIPEVNGRWELREVPAPRPGPGEVLVRVRACGVCSNDVMATRGIIPFPAVSPAITGHEVAGEIAEVGDGVTAHAVGDRVGVPWVQAGCGRCDYCRRGLPVTGQTAMSCPAAVSTGFTVQGGHAEYMVAKAEGTFPLPDGLSYESAAPVLCAGYTSWSALRQADPKPHERVAVVGIGALGHLALQFARSCGFETIAVTRSPGKHDLARELGADLVVGSGKELLEVGGADVILATASSSAAASESLLGLRPDGRLVLCGLDGTDSFNLAPDPMRPIFSQRHQITGATHNGPRYLREALELVAAGKVTPLVETFPMERVADAVDRVAKGDVRFRAVVTY